MFLLKNYTTDFKDLVHGKHQVWAPPYFHFQHNSHVMLITRKNWQRPPKQLDL